MSPISHDVDRPALTSDRSEKAHGLAALRDVPAVSRFQEDAVVSGYAAVLGSHVVKAAITGVLDDVRAWVVREAAALPSFDELRSRICLHLAREENAGLVEVINGTGILLHTNLGRAPLAREAVAEIDAIASGFSNLEYDLELGTRGSRYARVGPLLHALTGAEDSLVVNNCAAAVLLILDTFARPERDGTAREVIVSRNQLIEIGGGFRLPDVLARSGATLVEVGTTNRVYLSDFEQALSPRTALVLRTHMSNYRIEGFTKDVAPADLAAFGKRSGVVTVEDLGSGALVDLTAYGLPHERTAREALADGLDVVAFSGDKLLGGPQAGIIVGRAAAIAHMRANSLLRALRVDKATLAALAATLRLYAQPNGLRRIPLYAMLGARIDDLRARARALVAALRSDGIPASIESVATQAFAGGGTLPLAAIDSWGLEIRDAAQGMDAFAKRLRQARPRLVGRIQHDALLVDLRTIPAERDPDVRGAIVAALA